MFKIIENVNMNKSLVKFALALLDGILEDKRTRVKEFTAIEKAANPDRHVDTTNTLYNYIVQNQDNN